MDLAAYAVDGRAPSRVACPATGAEVAAIILAADRAGEAAVLHGGRTRIDVGDPPQRYDLAIDLRGVRGVVEHSAPDLVCTVRAGTTLAELARALAPAGQRWPVDAPDPERATVGGTIASAAPAPSRLRFQHPRDWIIGCEAVLGDGTLVRAGGRVVKNVTGYDLTRLYSGTYGTLCAITEVSLKLVAVDAARRVFRLRGAAGGLAATAIALRATFPFESIVLESGAGTSLYVCAAGEAVTVARATAELERHGSFTEVALEEWDAMLARTVRDPTAARCALPYGRETEVPLGQGLAYVGAGTAYALGERTSAELAALRAACEALGGALILERAPAELRRAVGTWGASRAPGRVASELKRRFDPRGVLAPGRMPLA